MSSRGAEQVLDCLGNGVRTTQVEGDVPNPVDEAVLALRNRFGQRRVEPPLALDLLAEQGFGRAARHRLLEGVDAHGGQDDPPDMGSLRRGHA